MSGPVPEAGGRRDEMARVMAEAMEAFNRRDWAGFYAATTEDFVLRTDIRWPGGGEYRDRDAQMGFLEQFLEPWSDLRYERIGEPEMFAPDLLIERGSWNAHGATSGLGGRLEFTVVVSFRGDRARRTDFFLKHSDALGFAAREEAGG